MSINQLRTFTEVAHISHAAPSAVEFGATSQLSAVVIAAGSNVNKEINIPRALAALAELNRLQIHAISAPVQTKAVGADGNPLHQPDFHNLALWGHTTMSQGELVDQLRSIEHDLGRRRSPDKFAPRPIDLDIAVYVTADAGELHTFVADDTASAWYIAAPIAQILPDWVHPCSKLSISEIAHSLAAGNSIHEGN